MELIFNKNHFRRFTLQTLLILKFSKFIRFEFKFEFAKRGLNNMELFNPFTKFKFNSKYFENV